MERPFRGALRSALEMQLGPAAPRPSPPSVAGGQHPAGVGGVLERDPPASQPEVGGVPVRGPRPARRLCDDDRGGLDALEGLRRERDRHLETEPASAQGLAPARWSLRDALDREPVQLLLGIETARRSGPCASSRPPGARKQAHRRRGAPRTTSASLPAGGGRHRHHRLDSAVEVAAHQIRRPDVPAVSTEVVDTGVLEVAPAERAHPDVLGHPGDPRTHPAGAAHDEVDPRSGARRRVERFDDFGVDEVVALDDDPAVP